MMFAAGTDWLGVAATPLLTAGLLVFSALLIVVQFARRPTARSNPGSICGHRAKPSMST